METTATKLFIVDDNKLLVMALKHFLTDRFGDKLDITTFYEGQSCLEKIDTHTHIVILDYFMAGKNGLDVLKEIKATHPKTEVIMLTTNEDIAIAIETFRAGAKDYVVKGGGYWKRINKLVDQLITKPIRIIVKGFSK